MRREPILMKKLTKEKTQGKLIIGIMGTHTGAGVTHLGILLATYLSEYRGQRIAFIECSPRTDLQYLKQYFFDQTEDIDHQDFFTIRRVTFYQNKNLQGIPEIVGDKYDCVILDLNTDMVKNKSEFLRCDKKIIVSSLTVWKIHELDKFTGNTAHIKNCEQWIYAISFAQNKALKEGIKRLQKNIYGIPYEPDPFILTEEVIHFFQKFI
ncbi:MAG: hypothetical protein WCD89_21265 [Anaerocolumna sp.]